MIASCLERGFVFFARALTCFFFASGCFHLPYPLCFLAHRRLRRGAESGLDAESAPRCRAVVHVCAVVPHAPTRSPPSVAPTSFWAGTTSCALARHFSPALPVYVVCVCLQRHGMSQHSLTSCPELVCLLEEGEELEGLLALQPEAVLLRWFNYHLERVRVLSRKFYVNATARGRYHA